MSEPRFLKTAPAARAAPDLVDRVTSTFAHMPDKRSDECRTLRQTLGYCWRVVTVAAPERGWDRLEHWAQCSDSDVRWVIREDLKKARLTRLDPDRVARLKDKLI